MSQPLGVIENLETTPRYRLFTFLGVDWLGTPTAWMSIPIFISGGLLFALFASPALSVPQRLLTGLLYGVLLYLANFLHTTGHILGGRMVGAPMTANLITATRHVNQYEDRQEPTRRVHLGRALGGPLMNILVGLACLLLAALTGAAWLGFFGTTNLVIGLGALAPVPSVDGEVIWRELLSRPPRP